MKAKIIIEFGPISLERELNKYMTEELLHREHIIDMKFTVTTSVTDGESTTKYYVLIIHA